MMFVSESAVELVRPEYKLARNRGRFKSMPHGRPYSARWRKEAEGDGSW